MENIIPLPKLPAIIARLTRNRKRPHIRTVYRWAEKGVGGRRLRTKPIGNTLCTTKAWLDEFMAERTDGESAAELRSNQTQLTAAQLDAANQRAISQLKSPDFWK